MVAGGDGVAGHRDGCRGGFRTLCNLLEDGEAAGIGEGAGDGLELVGR